MGVSRGMDLLPISLLGCPFPGLLGRKQAFSVSIVVVCNYWQFWVTCLSLAPSSRDKMKKKKKKETQGTLLCFSSNPQFFGQSAHFRPPSESFYNCIFWIIPRLFRCNERGGAGKSESTTCPKIETLIFTF